MSDTLARVEAENTAQQIVEQCGFTGFPICPFEIAEAPRLSTSSPSSRASQACRVF